MISIPEAQLLGWLASFLLPFFRILGIFTAAPILSARSFPGRVRISLALLIANGQCPDVLRDPWRVTGRCVARHETARNTPASALRPEPSNVS